MAMRETDRSAQIYFFASGGLGVLYGVFSMIQLAKLPERGRQHEQVVALWCIIVLSLIVSILFVIAGIDLPRSLRTGSRWIQRMLVAIAVPLVLWVPLSYLSHDFRYDPEGAMAQAVAALIGIVIPLAIVIYLYVNIRRLAKEARARSSGSAQ